MKSYTLLPAKIGIPAFAAGLLSAASLLAQTTPAPSAATGAKPADSEVVDLSPFVVNDSTDVGYIATRAAGATKTSTPMIDLPHSIQVLNSEFIADTASNNMFQAARYVSNVAGGSQRGDDAMLIRGFAVTRLR